MVFFRFLAAVPGFFLSSLFFMLLWGAFAPGLGIATIGYGTAMLITLALWLAVSPLLVVRRRRVW